MEACGALAAPPCTTPAFTRSPAHPRTPSPPHLRTDIPQIKRRKCCVPPEVGRGHTVGGRMGLSRHGDTGLSRHGQGLARYRCGTCHNKKHTTAQRSARC